MFPSTPLGANLVPMEGNMRLIPKQEYLEKTALDPRLLIAGGAALGGLGGYAASDDHPVLGTLGGAALGAGAGIGAHKLLNRGAGRMLPAHPAPMRVNSRVVDPGRYPTPPQPSEGIPALAGRQPLKQLPAQTATEAQYVNLERPLQNPPMQAESMWPSMRMLDPDYARAVNELQLLGVRR